MKTMRYILCSMSLWISCFPPALLAADFPYCDSFFEQTSLARIVLDFNGGAADADFMKKIAKVETSATPQAIKHCKENGIANFGGCFDSCKIVFTRKDDVGKCELYCHAYSRAAWEHRAGYQKGIAAENIKTTILRTCRDELRRLSSLGANPSVSLDSFKSSVMEAVQRVDSKAASAAPAK